jgi:hypothetical protein
MRLAASSGMRARKAFSSPTRVEAMELKLQDDRDVANCGPWVAVLAGVVQMWECYRQTKEGTSWAEVQGGIRDILTLRELVDLKREPVGAGANIEYIWE